MNYEGLKIKHKPLNITLEYVEFLHDELHLMRNIRTGYKHCISLEIIESCLNHTNEICELISAPKEVINIF